MRLSALPLLEGCALGYALHAFSFLLVGFATGSCFLPDRGPCGNIRTSSYLSDAPPQPVLHFRNAFTRDRRDLVEVELQFLRVLAQFGNLLWIGHVHL